MNQAAVTPENPQQNYHYKMPEISQKSASQGPVQGVKTERAGNYHYQSIAEPSAPKSLFEQHRAAQQHPDNPPSYARMRAMIH